MIKQPVQRVTVDQWRSLQLRRGRPGRESVRLLELHYAVDAAHTMQQLTLPFHLESRSNFRGHTRSRGHCSAIRRQRGQTKLFLQAKAQRPQLPCTIRFVRIAPRTLDEDDNLPNAFKAVRDGVCDWLGIDDRKGCPVKWDYDQEPAGPPRTYGCRIEIPLQPEGAR